MIVNWIKWDINKQPNLIKELLSKDKIIFLDITAEWCITCKYNKLFVIDNESIVKNLMIWKSYLYNSTGQRKI